MILTCSDHVIMMGNTQVQELVVQKCIASANPGDVLRRLIECISSGMILPGTNIWFVCIHDPLYVLKRV